MPYSIRHTYITMRLIDGVSIHRESSNVGTLIKMIENYYGHLRNRDPNVVSEITKTLYIEPGSPWENGHCESFNSKLRDEILAREIFYDLREAKALIEGWRIHYNNYRPLRLAISPQLR